MQKIHRYLLLVLSAALVSSCLLYMPENELYNNTGKDLKITLVFSQSEKTITLKNNQSASIGVPRTFKIQTVDTTWHYDDQPIMLKYHKYLGKHTFLAKLQIEQNGTIYLLLPDSTAPVDSFPPQPEGFPLKPEMNS